LCTGSDGGGFARCVDNVSLQYDIEAVRKTLVHLTMSEVSFTQCGRDTITLKTTIQAVGEANQYSCDWCTGICARYYKLPGSLLSEFKYSCSQIQSVFPWYEVGTFGAVFRWKIPRTCSSAWLK
jgi:hypothetical protein